MTLIVNGLDITNYVAFGGMKISRNDVDGPNAGRNLQGTMIRDRVAMKRKIEVTCVPLTETQLRPILAALEPDSFNVTYTDVQYGNVTKLMYANNFSWKHCIKRANGTVIYDGFSFPLIEI